MVNIREAEAADLPALADLEVELFSPPYKLADLQYFALLNDAAIVQVLELAGEIIGFFILLIMFEQAQLAQIGVKKAYQKQGFGRLLLEQVMKVAKENDCDSLTLEVRFSNCAALKLYQSYQFIQLARKNDYYQRPKEDAWLLGRAL